jgi:hypothetical protein
MICRVCKRDDEDLRMGVCFDCATTGDIRLGSRSVLQHLAHGVSALFRGACWMARMDFKCAWERLRRTGDYAPGREWEHL